MKIECRELRSFLVLAEQLHFGRAAARLHISQPALSKQIKLLEQKVGGPLLARNPRDTKLTAAGSLLYEEGKRMIRDLDALADTVRLAIRGEVGRLRIGTGISTVHSVVPPALRHFREAYPDVRVQVGDMSTPEQIAGLVSGEIDLGFVRLPVVRPQIAVRKILQDDLTIVASSRLEKKLTLDLLAGQPFVMLSREISVTYYDHCMRLCSNAHFSPRVVQEARDMFTLLNLVRAGIGVALVPRSAFQMRVADIHYSPIRMPEAAWDIGLAWNRQRESPMINNFVQICLRYKQDRTTHPR